MSEEAFNIIAGIPHINGPADIISIILFLFFSLYLVLRIVRLFRIRQYGFYFGLYCFHLLFTFLYYYITKYHIITGDSVFYYSNVISPHLHSRTLEFGISTKFITSIVSFLVHFLNFSYLSCFILFSTIGFWGMYLFIVLARKSGASKGIRSYGFYIFPFLLFLPNIHVWTVALGKDSLIFFGIMLLTYSLVNIKKHYILFVLGSFIIFMIRPHVYVLVLLSLFLTIMIWSKSSIFIKAPILFVITILGYQTLQFLTVKVFGLDFTLNAITTYLENRQGYYNKANYGGSTTNISSYPFLFKFFSYLYRPLFEKFTFNFFLVSIDNLFSLLFTLSLFSRKFIYWLNTSAFYIKFSLIYFLVGVTLFASLFSNFGIATRQKTMFIFSLYIVILAFLSWQKQVEQNRKIRT